jgi:hypothetical protein
MICHSRYQHRVAIIMLLRHLCSRSVIENGLSDDSRGFQDIYPYIPNPEAFERL